MSYWWKIAVIVYILFVLVALEAWHRSSISDLFAWAGENPYVFFLNFLILMALYMLVVVIVGRQRVSLWFVSYFMLLIFTISRIKMNLKGEPLLPWDIFLGNEAANIHEYFVLMSVGEGLIFFVIALVFFSVPFIFSNKKMTYRLRAVVVIFPLMMFLLLFFEKPVSLLEFGEVKTVFWDQSITYQRNGLQVGFLSTLQLLNIDPPEGYSEKSVNEVVRQLESESRVELSDNNPNIIIVMNEAFWDPTRLPGLQFSEDPLPFFRELQNSSTSGELLVPVFGGSTANTEFEILTGNSIDFVPPGSTPYSQYVHDPHPSLASIFRNQGYKAVAVHGYHNWFYRRDHVYRQFGFDRFVSQNFFEEPEYRRQLISDREMSNRIIFEHKISDQPLFIFAVTMQNHGPYNAKHYSEDRVTVAGEIPEDTKKVLATYSTGVKDADDSLRLLVNYFEKSGEPTVIVFFGDHLPYLGAGYRAYTETNYLADANPDNWSKADYQKMYTVPFVIWDNFSAELAVEVDRGSDVDVEKGGDEQWTLERKADSDAEFNAETSADMQWKLERKNNDGVEYREVDAKIEADHDAELYMNSSFLAAFLLEKYGFQQPPLMKYQNMLIAKNRSIISTKEEINQLSRNDIKQYELLQYDQLFGEGYGIADHFSIVSNQYRLGSERLKIKGVTPERLVVDDASGEESELSLVIAGENFTYKTTVYINGYEVETAFQNSSLIVATVPPKYHEGEEAIKIRVVIKDSKNRELSQSEEWELSIETRA